MLDPEKERKKNHLRERKKSRQINFFSSFSVHSSEIRGIMLDEMTYGNKVIVIGRAEKLGSCLGKQQLSNYTCHRQLPEAKVREPLPIAAGKNKPAKLAKNGENIGKIGL